MEYKLYKFKFNTPVHFGSDNSLEESDFICHSDTLFSALCLEYIKLNGDENLYKFIELFDSGEFLISSLLPYKDKDLYIPKPSIVVERDNKKDDENISSSNRKKMKKLEFIKVADLDNYLNSIKGNSDFEFDNMNYNKFSEGYLFQKVALRVKKEKNRLYTVGVHRFYKDCGLYFILAYNNKNNLNIFEQILKSLSYSGIGGKKTAGYGHFDFCGDNNISAIDKLLFKDAKYKMLLSLYSPNESELENINLYSHKSGSENIDFYSLIKRNGFIYSTTYNNTLLKRKSLCMFKEGSCFINNIKGDIKDVSHNGNHKVYRYGKALYIGIDF